MDIKLNERIRLARKRTGLTQEQLAEKIGIAFQTLNKYEKGHRLPDAEVLRQIAIITGVDAGWLLTGEEESAIRTAAEKEAPYEPTPMYTPEEREYIEKLITVLRNPDTKKAIKEDIDTFLKVPRPEPERKKKEE